MQGLGGSRDEMFTPATWTDCEGSVKTGSVSPPVKDVRD